MPSRSTVAAAGLERRFDAVLSVEEVGVFKPDRRVYQLAESQQPDVAASPLPLHVSAGSTAADHRPPRAVATPRAARAAAIRGRTRGGGRGRAPDRDRASRNGNALDARLQGLVAFLAFKMFCNFLLATGCWPVVMNLPSAIVSVFRTSGAPPAVAPCFMI
jgi:hypothetical protein